MPIYSTLGNLSSPGTFTVEVYPNSAAFWANDGIDQNQIKVFILNRLDIEEPVLLNNLHLKNPIPDYGLAQTKSKMFDHIALSLDIKPLMRSASGYWAVLLQSNQPRVGDSNAFFNFIFTLGDKHFYRKTRGTDKHIFQLPLRNYFRMIRAYNSDGINFDNINNLIPHDGLCGILENDGGNYRVAFTLFRYNGTNRPVNNLIAKNDIIIYQFDGGGGDNNAAGARIPAP